MLPGRPRPSRIPQHSKLMRDGGLFHSNNLGGRLPEAGRFRSWVRIISRPRRS